MHGEFRDHADVTEIGLFHHDCVKEGPSTRSRRTSLIRVDAGGRALVFSGDTGVRPARRASACGADPALQREAVPRCYLPDLRRTSTSRPRSGREHGMRGVDRLVLTHTVPGGPAVDETSRRRLPFGDVRFAAPASSSTPDRHLRPAGVVGSPS